MIRKRKRMMNYINSLHTSWKSIRHLSNCLSNLKCLMPPRIRKNVMDLRVKLMAKLMAKRIAKRIANLIKIKIKIFPNLNLKMNTTKKIKTRIMNRLTNKSNV